MSASLLVFPTVGDGDRAGCAAGDVSSCFTTALDSARPLLAAAEPLRVDLTSLRGGSPAFGWSAKAATVSGISRYRVTRVRAARTRSDDRLSVNSTWVTPSWQLSVDVTYHSWARNGTITYRAPARVRLTLGSVLTRLHTELCATRPVRRSGSDATDPPFHIEFRAERMSAGLRFLSWLEREDGEERGGMVGTEEEWGGWWGMGS
ncbi:hypothetical protein FJT64_002099 [Amphibalanus amphitrite]|uniref:Uncharacterized protein n=1 Tax=Amphibalanus amphitrite TaxID=1232801 RepID=A0A6A4WZ17_AMPAM|nr:hypothetical protein FJT64_002099 [Amphibalanus amphitrite]